MNVLSDAAAVDIKSPCFDGPDSAYALTEPLSLGSRVFLIYQGQKLSARVTAIERLGTMFVGRVLGFSSHESHVGELTPGDLVRFRPRDVHSTD